MLSDLVVEPDVLIIAFNDRVAPASLSFFTGYGWVIFVGKVDIWMSKVNAFICWNGDEESSTAWVLVTWMKWNVFTL